jgi:pSer/pThr/pTyr-binding forkhead associated (FHA) protein
MIKLPGNGKTHDFFRGKAIHSALFENGVVHIGRDETNDLIIDSLAVAPAHAAIIIHNVGCTARQLNDDFPLVINGIKTQESNLINKDKISLGKHDIVYHLTESVVQTQQLSSPLHKDLILLNQELSGDVNIPGAKMCLLSIIHPCNFFRIKPMPSKETPDNRNYHRILYKAEATLSCEEKIWPCKITDLS